MLQPCNLVICYRRLNFKLCFKASRRRSDVRSTSTPGRYRSKTNPSLMQAGGCFVVIYFESPLLLVQSPSSGPSQVMLEHVGARKESFYEAVSAFC